MGLDVIGLNGMGWVCMGQDEMGLDGTRWEGMR